MSGTAAELTFDSTSHIEERNPRNLALDCLDILLTGQWVTSSNPEISHLVWEVVGGTSMGLGHSGDLAEVALLNRMETWPPIPVKTKQV